MGNCKDCKWWEQWYDLETHRECTRIGNAWQHSDDSAFIERDLEQPDYPLLTRADFGCVLFEQREV